MLSMCDNVLAQLLPGEAIALNNDFEKRVASTLPDETLFLHAYAGAASIKEVKDGRLLNIVGRLEKQVSEDGGETWTEPLSLTDGSGNQIVGSAANLVVLKSGALGLIYAYTPEGDKGRPAWFIRSDDEGETWSDPVMVSEPGVMAAIWNDTAIVTSSGRIVIPVYWYVGKRVIIPQGVGASVGLLGDEWAGVGGHGYENIIDVSWVYYSDDEGRTWQRNEDGEMMVTIDYSAGGHFSCEESVIAEVSPNHLLNVHRTQLGRLYQSWSDDDGSTWSHPEPTTLASSRAPACLRRVPGYRRSLDPVEPSLGRRDRARQAKAPAHSGRQPGRRRDVEVQEERRSPRRRRDHLYRAAADQELPSGELHAKAAVQRSGDGLPVHVHRERQGDHKYEVQGEGAGHRSAASRQGSTDHYYAGPTPSVVLPGMTSARYGQDVTPRKD